MIKDIQLTRTEINVPLGFSIKGGIESDQPFLITRVRVINLFIVEIL